MNYDDIEMKATLLGERRDDTGWVHDAWNISLTRGSVTIDVAWKAGTGHRNKPTWNQPAGRPRHPEKLDVLHSLQLDVRILEYDEFDDIGCTGYHERVALEGVLRDERDKLVALFGDQYRAFLNDEELMDR